MDGASESISGGDGGNSKRCPRCGLYFSSDSIDCPHCSGLSEKEAFAHGKSVTESLKRYTIPIAKLFFYLAGVIVLITVFMLSAYD